MAKRKHGGLGRGLDALIPRAPQEARQESRQEETRKQENSADKRTVDLGAGENSPAGSDLPANTALNAKHAGPNAAEEKNDANDAAQKASPDAGSGTAASDSQDASANAGGASALAAEADAENGSAPAAEADAGNGSAPAPAAEPNGVQMLRLSQVDPNRSQPRNYFADDSLEELADSIRQFGVIQPILVQKKGSRYEIIAGERRWRASRKAGLKEIPAIVREYSDQETVELSLIENIQREDLNPIEEAQAYKRLLDEFDLRQEDLAARVSKSRTAITNALRLLKLDRRVQNMIIQGQISMGHARALLPVEIPDEQFLLAQQAAEKHLSVRDVEKMIKTRLGGKKKKTGASSAAGSAKTTDPALELAYRSIEERLKQSLGTKASIRHGGDGSGKLEIEFYSHEDLEKIVDLLT